MNKKRKTYLVDLALIASAIAVIIYCVMFN